MATDMGRGIVAPDSNDNISSSGVREMRTIATTAAAAISQAEEDLKADVIAPLDERTTDLEQIPRLPDNTDLNDLTGTYTNSRRWRAAKPWGIKNAPADAPNTQGLFRQFRTASNQAVQWWTDRFGTEWMRVHDLGEWTAWRRTGAGGEALRTGVERDGEWTGLEDELTILQALAGHREATYIDAGRTVQGRVIPALRIGFPEYPTVLLVAGQHGTEPGPREGLLRVARELLDTKNYARFDISILIVPNANPDGRAAFTRNNANGVNLNRDWQDFSQPETQAIRDLINDHHVVAAVDFHNGGTPRYVNFSPAESSSINTGVRERGERLYDAVWEAVLDVDEQPRKYVTSGDPGLMTEGLAVGYQIPSLIAEIPTIPLPDRDDRVIPPRAWMLHATSIVAHSVVNTVWHERQAFIAAEAGETYTIPERHVTVLEQARTGGEHHISVDTSVGTRVYVGDTMIYGDTGWRDVTASIPNVSRGNVYLRRLNQNVTMFFSEVTIDDLSSSWVQLDGFLPTGWRSELPGFMYIPSAARNQTYSSGPVRVANSGQLVIYDARDKIIALIATWPVGQSWPTSLPGSPA